MNLKNKLKTTKTYPKNNPKPHWFRRSKEDKALVRDQDIFKIFLGELEQIKINQISSLPSRETEIQVQTGDLH